MKQFQLIETKKNGIRVAEITTPHGVIHTPFFMPVGTVGAVKGIAPWELKELGAEIVLSNIYHLYLRPGIELIRNLGGLHTFMNWPRPILTDSGGYQVFSLAKNNFQFSISNFQTNSVIPAPPSVIPAEAGIHRNNESGSHISPLCLSGHEGQANLQPGMTDKGLVKVSDDGVEFRSHLDGSKHFFTPEKVIQMQLDLGVDILMPLDVCPSGRASLAEVKRATELTIKWAKRAKCYFESRSSILDSRVIKEDRIKNQKIPISNTENPKSIKAAKPLLYGIVQGGLNPDLRKKCAKKLIAMDFGGYAVGGLAVDLETRNMWHIVKLMGEILPENKPRYLMGVGTPDDIIMATSLGMDMFDCVLPTRLARHGSVYSRTASKQESKTECLPEEHTNLLQPEAGRDTGPLAYRLINLFNSQYRSDSATIDKNCRCPLCQDKFSRAYISHLLRSGEMLGLRLTTLHNLWQYLNLMRELSTDRN